MATQAGQLVEETSTETDNGNFPNKIDDTIRNVANTAKRAIVGGLDLTKNIPSYRSCCLYMAVTS